MIVDNNMLLSIGQHTAPRYAAPPPPPPPPPVNDVPVYRKLDLKWRQYDSRWCVPCRQCHQLIQIGQPIMWSLGFGSFHIHCYAAIPPEQELEPIDYYKAAQQKEKNRWGNR